MVRLDMNTTSLSRLPWDRINNYLLETGSIREPEAFIDKSIENIAGLVPFEQARFFFFNMNGKIRDFGQVGTKKDWTDAYLEYYSKIDDGKYSIRKLIEDYHKYYGDIDISIKNWTNQTEDEFLKDYIKPQGIKHSAIFAFHANDDYVKCVFALDRVSRAEYTEQEEGSYEDSLSSS